MGRKASISGPCFSDMSLLSRDPCNSSLSENMDTITVLVCFCRFSQPKATAKHVEGMVNKNSSHRLLSLLHKSFNFCKSLGLLRYWLNISIRNISVDDYSLCLSQSAVLLLVKLPSFDRRTCNVTSPFGFSALLPNIPKLNVGCDFAEK